jgi:hypothetical protein
MVTCGEAEPEGRPVSGSGTLHVKELPMVLLHGGVGDDVSHTSRSAQAAARPSQVDDRRQTTANTETSTHR